MERIFEKVFDAIGTIESEKLTEDSLQSFVSKFHKLRGNEY